MASRVFSCYKNWESMLQISASHPFCSTPLKSLHSISLLKRASGRTGALARNGALGYGFVHGFKVLKGCDLRRCCRASFDEFSYEELSKQVDDLAEKLSLSEDEDDEEEEAAFVGSQISPILTYPEDENAKGNGCSLQVSSLKLNAMEPSLLGIHPEPPDWPERTEIVRVNIERKANSLGFPVSLRLIKKKKHQESEESPKGQAGDFTVSSLNKAFSSMVFIIRELHGHALSIRESLYSEDLQEIIGKVQKREMNMSFVWLFQQVFSGSPTLMVYVMILLANFSLYSMDRNAALAASPLPVISENLMEEKPKLKSNDVPQEQKVSVTDSIKAVKKALNGEVGENLSQTRPVKNAIINPEKMYGISLFNKEEFKAEEEVKLWNNLVEEASRMQAEMRDEALDHETLQKFVTPTTVIVEPDHQEHFFRTDLLYQMGLAREPNNPLLLSNYAQFLYVVAHDHNRAEACFRRAVQEENPDAEAVSRYADFLWIVRKDLWGAEERHQQAMAIEPYNPYYASRYANFLWSTGGEDTCFPLNAPYDNYNKVV